MLSSNQKLAGVQVQELFLIRTDRRHVFRRMENTSDAGKIIEPKLGRAIDVVVRKSRKRLAC